MAYGILLHICKIAQLMVSKAIIFVFANKTLELITLHTPISYNVSAISVPFVGKFVVCACHRFALKQPEKTSHTRERATECSNGTEIDCTCTYHINTAIRIWCQFIHHHITHYTLPLASSYNIRRSLVWPP